MRNLTAVLALRYLGYAVAYDSGDKGWKKDADGKLVTDADGNPIYVDTNGAEKSLGADTVARLNREAKERREEAEAANAALKKFGDFKPEQVKDALAALETVKNIKDGDLIKAGEAERVKQEIKASYDTQLQEERAKNTELTGALSSLRLGNAFGSSEFIKNNIAVPVPMMEATFGKHFKYENDQLIAYDNGGQKIYSRKRGGEIATVDEALEILVEASPFKDGILKGGGSGTGGGGAGGARGGARTMKRSDWEALAPAARADAAKKQAAGELTLVD